jgi:hypothetical protein
VCLMDREQGQFECATAAAAAAGSKAATDSTCAPLVRTTVQGRRCVLPFTWQGGPRDDCIWRNGMAVCPVAGSTAEAAAAGVITPSSSSSSSAAGAVSDLEGLLVSPTGGSPWVWQQCGVDYETRWEAPPADAPGRR